MTVRVLIVDDQALVRTGFRMILEAEEDIDVVGEAADGVEAITEARRLEPDVVLMDVRMPELDGIEATRRLLANGGAGETKVVMLTTFDMDEYVFDALRAGASGFLLKDVPPERLIDGIRAVANGDALLAPSITRRLIEEFVRSGPADAAPPAGLGELTARELEVLQAHRARALERRDREGAVRQRDDGEDARRARADEARPARPGAGGRARVRVRPRAAGQHTGLTKTHLDTSKFSQYPRRACGGVSSDVAGADRLRLLLLEDEAESAAGRSADRACGRRNRSRCDGGSSCQ